jgi:cation transport ATPase
VAIFDKTGTLTCGRPALTEQSVAPGLDPTTVLGLAASLERYSRHPLARAVVARAQASGAMLRDAVEVSDPPGHGLRGIVDGREVELTSRRALAARTPTTAAALPPGVGGLECVVLIDGEYAAMYRFRDEPRSETAEFVAHLKPRHGIRRVLIVSGDRESEVRYFADRLGLTDVFAERTPEQKVAIVREETSRARTLYVGDGINDAPALASATVGVAIAGGGGDVAAAAADVVILGSSLAKVDEFMHVGRRMRAIALQSAVGGIALSLAGMAAAAFGWLTPVQGAVAQEVIDLFAVLNALRVALPPRLLTDFETRPGSPSETGAGLDASPHGDVAIVSNAAPEAGSL